MKKLTEKQENLMAAIAGNPGGWREDDRTLRGLEKRGLVRLGPQKMREVSAVATKTGTYVTYRPWVQAWPREVA